ncbi:HAMP domain-containing histidine kinase [Intestinimonas massiliensis]|uniref:histidine kinase n=1 Tax=Intestinimonas massiliensis (ex Afouda et al. 2020) TaxID=1673721 RepID=A0ABS9MDL2_9FIRM|nr:HAMP domain-containing sensor histidine kinase [Intestinimonas massiliensis (ex Afouda et al. 2020)]MCG4528887.1 HAMP domain-containing histidine kinase [Intestinimonas massiliensis (ex Afouda et al. 2020)]MCQ4805340.1 HAMP domain-containing histidine kinase [Intestinimonas massiliensis (ex Afouda et al. 2020)]
MIKRLRIKFVCINMTIVTIMLCVIFGLVLHFTSVSMEKESIEMMQSVALDPLQLGTPGKGASGVRLPYFALQLGPGGELLASGGGYYDLTDRALLNELISLSSVQKTGVLSDYGLRYVRVVTPTMQCIVFADMSSEINTINNLLQNCLLIGAASFIIFLMISILLARWAVKPVAVAWEQQRQFVANASHELKTPLTVILSNAQMLAENVEDPELRKRMTASILTVSQQMKDLVTKLLSSAQVDQGIGAMQFSAVDLSHTVSNALLPFAPIFYEQGMELDSVVQDDIWVQGSQPHLIQVVNILLDNAQKYGVEHGHTRVTLRQQGKKSCLLTVANEGKALSGQELKNIFKRFYRADAARERTGSYGLGLSIAEGIVQAHRGKIWAESKDGVNTFLIQLPTTSVKP